MKCQIVCFVLSLLASCVVSSPCTTPSGVQSQCVSLYSCKDLLVAFEQRPIRREIVTFLKQSQCGFEGYTPKVCCGPLPTNRPTTTQTPQTTYRPVSVKPDPVSSEDSNPAPPGQCGIDSDQDRIYGGQITDLDEFPWMVLLGYLTKENKMTYQCGGVMVNKRYVMTAAHCVKGEIENVVGQLTSARLGEYDIQTATDCIDTECAEPVQEIRVMSAHPHPGFVDGRTNREDDIAIVRLAHRAKESYYVKPICLVDPGLRVTEGDEVFVAGWGKTLQSTRSQIKLKLGMPIYETSTCFKKYRQLGADLTDKQICAGGVFAEDACRGDSGGPLMRRRPNGVWESVGVVSFGYGCGREGWPGVYTSVAKYLPWIKETIRTTNV